MGGSLPGWFARLGPAASKQAAILTGCAVTLLAVWPALRLRFPEHIRDRRTTYAWSPFLLRFLAVVTLWNVGTGSFNPFFNAYFARYLHFQVAQIGTLFSVAQLAQVAAVLLAPLVLRRLGLPGGIGAMQMASGAAMFFLISPSPFAGALAYVSYMSFQWMSEPGMNTVLMNNVAEEARAGASALNYLVMFSAQALAAGAAGWAIARSGYPPVLAAAGSLALVAGGLFIAMIRPGGRNS
jgi:predicted MFS family arabinose efflux permease